MKETVTLSIKNVPIELVEKLRQQARRNHRSLQGELLAIVEENAYRNTLTPREVLNAVRASGHNAGSVPQQMD
ncbi:MAG: Arc family DNA-binding protein [Gammaproteobacteria bacterium]|nr:Arc family DNA-binding protein [Gammaproteobacteria bacterium]